MTETILDYSVQTEDFREPTLAGVLLDGLDPKQLRIPRINTVIRIADAQELPLEDSRVFLIHWVWSLYGNRATKSLINTFGRARVEELGISATPSAIKAEALRILNGLEYEFGKFSKDLTASLPKKAI